MVYAQKSEVHAFLIWPQRAWLLERRIHARKKRKTKSNHKTVGEATALQTQLGPRSKDDDSDFIENFFFQN